MKGQFETRLKLHGSCSVESKSNKKNAQFCKERADRAVASLEIIHPFSSLCQLHDGAFGEKVGEGFQVWEQRGEW